MTRKVPLCALALTLALGCDLSPADDDAMESTTGASTGGEETGGEEESGSGSEGGSMSSSGEASSGGVDSSGESGSDDSTGSDADTPPELAITEPAMDLPGDMGPVYDDYDMDLELWYVDVDLAAMASDAEDGDIGASVEWTTDQSGIQDAALGSGASITVRLYSDDCFGTTHTITAAVTDSDGNMVTADRILNIWTLC